jgi:hypothetical protein
LSEPFLVIVGLKSSLTHSYGALPIVGESRLSGESEFSSINFYDVKASGYRITEED